jgi:hypothetical protein
MYAQNTTWTIVSVKQTYARPFNALSKSFKIPKACAIYRLSAYHLWSPEYIKYISCANLLSLAYITFKLLFRLYVKKESTGSSLARLDKYTSTQVDKYTSAIKRGAEKRDIRIKSLT